MYQKDTTEREGSITLLSDGVEEPLQDSPPGRLTYSLSCPRSELAIHGMKWDRNCRKQAHVLPCIGVSCANSKESYVAAALHMSKAWVETSPPGHLTPSLSNSPGATL